MTKLSRYFIWLGVAFLMAGIVIGLAVTATSIAAYAFISVGLLVLMIGISVNARTQTFLDSFLSRRATQIGTNGILSAIAVLMMLCFINIIAAQFPLRIDLTETKIHTLSSQTKTVLKDLDQPLKILLFQDSDEVGITPLLESYHRLNPSKLDYEFVDPNVDVQQIERFRVQTRGEVHLEYGDKIQLVQTLALGERLNETQLTNSIIRIKGDRQPHLYILQGHGEPSLDGSQGGLVQMVKALEEQGYRVSPLNLAQTPEIPEDTNVIAIVAPKSALLPGEVKLLQNHLAQNKGLLILLDPRTDPQLEPLFSEWGVNLDQRTLVDSKNRSELLGLGETTLVITNYNEHPITQSFANNISLYQFVRPLKLTPKDDINATAILSVDEEVWAESDLQNPNRTFNPSSDLRGSLDFGLALQRAPIPDEENTEIPASEARLVVIGNSTFATNGWFEDYLNGDVLLNSINWLAQDKNTPLAICPSPHQDPIPGPIASG